MSLSLVVPTAPVAAISASGPLCGRPQNVGTSGITFSGIFTRSLSLNSDMGPIPLLMMLFRALPPSVTSLPKQQVGLSPLPPLHSAARSHLGSPLALSCSHWVLDLPDNISGGVSELRAQFSTPEHPRQLTSTISIPWGSERGRRVPIPSQSLSVSPWHTHRTRIPCPGTSLCIQLSTQLGMDSPSHKVLSASPFCSLRTSIPNTTSFPTLAWIMYQAALAEQPQALPGPSTAQFEVPKTIPAYKLPLGQLCKPF